MRGRCSTPSGPISFRSSSGTEQRLTSLGSGTAGWRGVMRKSADDSVVNLLLFGSSFTRQPRVTAREILSLASQDRVAELIQRPFVQRRIADLVAGAAAPGDNERLRFVARVMVRSGIDPRRYLEAELRRILAE